jgi:hypothetical protein
MNGSFSFKLFCRVFCHSNEEVKKQQQSKLDRDVLASPIDILIPTELSGNISHSDTEKMDGCGIRGIL